MAVPERWRDVVGLLMQVERLLDEGQEEALIPSVRFTMDDLEDSWRDMP